MAQVQGEKKESQGVFEDYNKEIGRLKRSIKGYQGEIAKLKKLVGPQGQTEVKSGPPEGPQGEPKAPQGPSEHIVRDWEHFCPDCGPEGTNINYKPPTVKCHNCGQFLTSDPAIREELKTQKKTDKIKACPGCNRNEESKDWTVVPIG